MAKKKKATRSKARGKKLSVKKRPVKDMSARQGKSVKGGALGETRALNFSSGAVKLNPSIAATKIE